VFSLFNLHSRVMYSRSLEARSGGSRGNRVAAGGAQERADGHDVTVDRSIGKIPALSLQEAERQGRGTLVVTNKEEDELVGERLQPRQRRRDD
jgi:hypothetical protein